MSDLGAYRAKRRFDRTREPSDNGAVPPSSEEAVFVVQRHDARRLHYDLRLEVNGVLKSWAVPEGPCLDPKVRRFAKQTEDHPLAYRSFEGVIPDGEYGAGDMIVWDAGTWTTLADDPAAALLAGELKFRLAGKKLGGGWMLKRMPGPDLTNWLLIKERDIAARPLTEYDVLAERPESVLGADAPARAARRPAASPPEPARLPGAVKGPLPTRFKPMLATAAAVVPAHQGWLHEIKYDGYRTLAFIDHGVVRLITRNGLDWTARYGALAKAFTNLPCETALIDGEIVVQDARGVAALDLLERALSENRTHALTFFAFDLPHLDGFDLTGVPLIERKRALAGLAAPVVEPRSQLQLSDHIDGDGAELFAHASRMGIEGVVSKKADSRYVSERSANWVKTKRVDVARFIIIGFTVNAPKSVAALILAEEGADGLVYACKAGSGIGDERARTLYRTFSPAIRPKPVVPTPKIEGAHWIEPNWTAEVGYRGRSGAGTPRQPAFLSLADRTPQKPSTRLKPRLVTDRELAGIHLTNPEREMLEGSGVTKLDIALYYAQVGDWALPELLRRPLTIIRCTTGLKKDLFYQRHAFPGLPPGVERVDLKDEEGVNPYITVTEPRGYLALAQFGAVEFHLWGCSVDDPEHPDRLVFDLDPDEALPWTRVCDGAEALKARLAALGFTPFIRTTGGKGVHLVVALKPEQPWSLTKPFAEAIARAAAADAPNQFVAVATKARRKGKIFIDYLRNGQGASAVASYSLRAATRYPVATPIDWSELRNLSGGDAFDRKKVVNRLESLCADPWEALQSSAIKITPAMRRDVGMKG